MIKYIIVDDEPLAHELIEGFCSMLPHLKLEKHCYNAMEAMECLNGSTTIDFMFLDINMPKLNGLDFLRTLNNPPKTIITTAYKEHALEGFELNVVEYLLKPFSVERLVKAVNKVVQTEEKTTKTKGITTLERGHRFFIKGDKKYHQISSDTILYIEAYGNYTKIFMKDEMIITHEKISNFEDFLPKDNFLRVHKSFIVALDKIKLIEGNRIKIETHEIPIGETYKSLITKLYNS